MRARAIATSLCLLTVLLAGCGVEELVRDALRGETPRERYVEALDRSGLGESALVRAWRSAGTLAFESPVGVAPPLREEVWLPPEEPQALGYLLEVRRGQRVEVTVEAEDSAQQIFVELFRIRGDAADDPPLLVGWTDPEEREIAYDARASARYLLRIQPELMGGGALSVSIRVGASLAFPVEGRSTGNVGSYFGDIRDGGARDHHGVDIFAPRGTPVLAASDGTVYRVGVNNLGGNVVWVRDPTGDLRQYYAHLDTQLVQRGQEVEVGDVLGLVGNTGNARSTPPHLHFGVYLRGDGAVDPMPFLHEPGGTAAELAVAREAFQDTWRVRPSGAPLRAAASGTADIVQELAGHLPVRITGGTGSWFRVRLPGGEQGYLAGSVLEPMVEALGRESLTQRVTLRTEPRAGAPRIRDAQAGEALTILGWSGSWAWVESDHGAAGGWMLLAEEE